MSDDLNPLYDPSTDNQSISDEAQKMINTDDAASFSPEDQAFVDLILNLVEEGTLKLHEPDSLINHSVYDSLSDEAKGLADQNAMAMLPKIRQIVDLSHVYDHPTYQLVNLVASLRQNKERLEKHSGDIFIL